MLEIMHKEGKDFHYRISGSLSADDLSHYYASLDRRYRVFGRLNIKVRVTGFRGYAGFRAVVLFLWHEPGLLRKVATYHAVADQSWLRNIVNGIGALVPFVKMKATATG